MYSSFFLGNSGDEIVISEGSTEIARLDYTFGSGFVVAGRSRELALGSSAPFTESDYVLAAKADEAL